MTNEKENVSAQLSAVFINIEDPTHIDEVIDRALEHRDKATEGTRSRLNAVVRNSITNLPGFRDASKAPNHQLRPPMILDMMKGNDRMAGAVLIAWMESFDSLRKIVTKHLEEREIPILGIDAAQGQFRFALEPGRVESRTRRAERSQRGRQH